MSSPVELVPRIITSFREPPPESIRPAPPRVPSGGDVVAIAGTREPTVSLLDVLRRRRSTRFYGADGLPADGVTDVARQGLDADRAAWPDAPVPLEVFAFALRVDPVERGMYGLEPDAGRWTRLGDLPTGPQLTDLTLQAEFCHSAVIVSLAADLAGALAVDGGHGYRSLMTRAGSAAHTMWLHAEARGWVGSVFAGFIPAAVRIPLSSDGSSRHQLFAVALGATAS